MDSRFQGRYGEIEVEPSAPDEITVKVEQPGAFDLSHADARTLAHLLLRAIGDERLLPWEKA